MRQTFVFNVEWLDVLSEYPPEVRLEVLEAAIRYAAGSGRPSFSSEVSAVAFAFISRDIDRNQRKYDERVERIRRTRSEAGKKGMARRWGKSITNDNKNNKNNYENENENENGNENVSTNVDDNIILANASTSGAGPDAQPRPQGGVSASDFLLFFNGEIDRAQSRIPHAKSVTGRRLAHLNARCAEFGWDAVAEAVRKAARSGFLNGGGSRGFIADLTWILRPNNFPRILEGFYDDNEQPLKLNSDGINQGRYTTKRDANEYALRKLVEARERYGNGVADDSPKPF